MKINDIIKVVKPIAGVPPEVVGKFGFIEDNEGLVQGVQHWIIIILDNDGTPFGNGPVPESAIELTEDPTAKVAVDIFNEQIKKLTEGVKVNIVEINKGLEVLAKKHNMTVAKLREIYTDVFEVTKGLINEQDSIKENSKT
jgi:hypothetical protein